MVNRKSLIVNRFLQRIVWNVSAEYADAAGFGESAEYADVAEFVDDAEFADDAE